MPRFKPYLLVLALCGAGCGGDDTCDPVQQSGCDDGKVCENVSGAKPACFDPVAIEGRVFDLSNNDGIEGANIVAVDVNGAAASNVVKSGANGAYKLPIPTDRNSDGTPAAPLEGHVTLRSDAVNYQSFPGTIRQPLPIDISTAVETNGTYSIKNTLTDIAMSKIEGGGTAGRIEGKVDLPDNITGAVVVATGGDGKGYPTIAARNGDYSILNLPAGDYTVQAYLVDHNYNAGTATVNANTVKVDFKLSDAAASAINGTVSIVNGNNYSMTSIVLFIESTFDPTTGRGVTVPGLRAPRTGVPDVTGAWTMDGVPAGNYVVVAAFENDGLVRDPDTCIAGTADVHITVDAAAQLAVDQTFKITGAMDIIDPGAAGVQSVTGTPTFKWMDDSGEDHFQVDLFDSYGQLVWTKTILGYSGGGSPSLLYDGPGLQQGMYYQFRVTSLMNGCALARTEDLKGVFYLP